MCRMTWKDLIYDQHEALRTMFAGFYNGHKSCKEDFLIQRMDQFGWVFKIVSIITKR